ncbi:MAG: hypothetical protein WDM81_21185 [Rhizomicrobium sp.]
MWCVFHAAGVLAAGNVVLATGHGSPQPLVHPVDDEASHAIVDDPWTAWSVEPTARVLIVGSGLTAIDTALSLMGRGHRGKDRPGVRATGVSRKPMSRMA